MPVQSAIKELTELEICHELENPMRRSQTCLSWLFHAAICLTAIGFAPVARGATLPTGFTESQIAGGLLKPVTMAFAPDGRIFLCEQEGKLRVIKNNALRATPFVTLDVNFEAER